MKLVFPPDATDSLQHGAGGASPTGPARRFLHPARIVMDRGAVLAVGFVAGICVGISFDLRRPAPPPQPAPVSVPVSTPQSSPPLPAEDAVDRRVVARVAQRGIVRVGVFGDSFGVGLWEALDHQLPRDKGFEVLRFAKEATGFTQYHRLNLEDRAREQLAADPVDVAVICFGANDAVPFYDAGHELPLLSEGWKRVVGERIDRFVAVTRSTGAAVYWVGLPAMRDARLDASIQAMNAFYAEHMRRLNVPFLETRSLSVDAEGRYAAYLPDDKTGARKLIRTNDGVHMLGVGYQHLTQGLASSIAAMRDKLRAGTGTDRAR
ncbi:SGNH/GDSL hydrolase family protein [Sphingomonas pituitosa]|uniref:SGNH/GDSL hydrolase family protein n=1 Tax=Sphingomonas pituitosa TaxID=99597 RepID=UPI0014712DA2|nr:GDSL-type esterase/lipase family protein [Sphingomonas pituitosa]